MLQIIYPGKDYENVLQSNNLTTLEQRRRDHCIKLASKLSEEDHKLNRLLPPRKCHMTIRNSISNRVFL